MKTYEKFWKELAPAFPVSKGEIRLPVVAGLQEVSTVDVSTVISELAVLLQQMLDEAGDTVSAERRAVAAEEHHLVPHMQSAYTGVVRFDCMLDTAGQLQVVELNADYPDGFVLHDHTYSVLADTPHTLHHDLLRELFHGAPSIHIAHPEEATFLDGYHAERVALEDAGHTVTVGPFGTGSRDAWQRRCVEVSKLAESQLAAHPVAAAPVINSWSLRTLGYKQLLASVTHALVPETITLDSTEAYSRLRTDHEQWVLKPGQGCEGAGIYFGRDYSDDDWKALVTKLPSGYVAQRYIDAAKRRVPVYDAGDIVERELFFDICPHFLVVAGTVVSAGHILMRFSESPVVNVSRGGAIGYHRLPDSSELRFL